MVDDSSLMPPRRAAASASPRAVIVRAKVLVVDDEADIRKVLGRSLAAAGFAVVSAENAADALLLAREGAPDLVVTDAQMPGLDGFALCRLLRQDPSVRRVPVILITGRCVSDEEMLAGFELGADDYVLKPFSLRVLQARVEAVLRRYQAAPEAASTLKACGLELDPAGRTVKVGGRPVALTRKEFDLLATLVQKPGRLLSVCYLLETVWGYDPADYNDPGTVEVHISHLRRKLGRSLARRIANVPGHGYKFEPGSS